VPVSVAPVSVVPVSVVPVSVVPVSVVPVRVVPLIPSLVRGRCALNRDNAHCRDHEWDEEMS
jgi:hypothetical protein